MSDLKTSLLEQIKSAMKSRQKEKLVVLRTMHAEIKKVEIDTREDLTDDAIIVIFTKMVKQRKESFDAFQKAGRDSLATIEKNEIVIIEEFLPCPLTDDEINSLVTEAITSTAATSIKNMGAVMAWLNPHMIGKADMKQVSILVKNKLTA